MNSYSPWNIRNNSGPVHDRYSNIHSVMLLISLCLLMTLTAGCSKSGVRQYTGPDMDVNSLQTVAVLPLKNFTADKHAAEKIRSRISIELLTRGVNIIEPGEIAMTLKELKIRSIDSMRKEDMVSMGDMLRADAVITGSVESFGISNGITVSYPEVSVHLMMFDTVSGNTMWSVWHTTGGASFWTRHFGAEGSTLDKVSERVIKEIFDALY